MTEPEAALGAPERLHPLSLLASLRASVRGMSGMLAAGGYFAVQGRWLLLVVVLGLFTTMSVGAALLRWSRFRFRVGEREIRIDSGLFSRTHRSIPFDRIQDVTVEQGPLARALGLARVRFETGGSSGAKEDDGSLAAIPLARAGEIRELVRASRGLAPEAAQASPVAAEAPVFAMDLKRVLLAGLFNFSLAVIGGLIGLSQTFGEAMGIDPFERSFWEGLFAPDSPLGHFFRQNPVMTFLGGSIVLLLVGLGTGLLRTTLRDFGFRLDRAASGLRRRRGLLTVTDVILPARRTQAAVIRSGPVRAAFGWNELKLQSLAKEDGGKGDHVVAPLADEEEVATVLAAIGWQPPMPGVWRRVSATYVLTFAIALTPLMVFALAAIAFRPPLGVLGLTILLIVLIGRGLAWRRYGYALEGHRLLVRSGWWRRRVTILPVRNLQSVDFVQMFVDRWFGTAGLVIGVAGGGLAGHRISALPAQTAREIRAQLLSPFA